MKQKKSRVFFAILLIIGLLVINVPQTAHAAGPWYVTTSGDDTNDCLSPSTPCGTINGAIGKATSGDTVLVATGTYTGSGTEVVRINKDITLFGGWDTSFTTQNGMATIDGQGSRTGISVWGVANATIEKFTVLNGYGYSTGGGISIKGSSLVLNDSIVNGNTDTSLGGGIFVNYFSVLTINRSAVVQNTALRGGGIYAYDSTVEINNSTISDNTAYWDGGGFYISGNSGLGKVNNSTIAENKADYGGGIFSGGGFTTITISNSIFSYNNETGGSDCFGTITSLGYNIIGNINIYICPIIGVAGDQLNIDPLLDTFNSLQGYYPLQPGSPAIDAGNPAGCTDQEGNLLTTDQRGVARPQGAACDIGAFEHEAVDETIEVDIDIKPHNSRNKIETKPREPNNDDKVSVAILSTPQFDAPYQVDSSSLTFGHTGDEDSLVRKGRYSTPDCRMRDINKDGLPDLVCKFYIQKTGFQQNDEIGTLNGMTLNGTSIHGQDSVKIVEDR